MRKEAFAFSNASGGRLSARLDLPDGQVRAHALFAHCFTCDKTSKAAVRISRALTGLGYGVLRFDFTGLGDSDGELTGFSGNVEDLIRVAEQMQAQGRAPALLIGHSLGGAAILAAAGQIASAKAVVSIAAPSEPAHVLKQLGGGLEKIEREGRAEVFIGGRPFTLDRTFVEDVRMQHLKERVATLRRPLLILHSPRDAIVGIDNAAAIFNAAHHPKSFISLDTADHLLTKGEDGDYAATVIAAWARRYAAMDASAAPADDGVVHVQETRAGKFQVQVAAGGESFFADEPAAMGGLGSGPSPYELVAAGLGACTCMTLRLYADLKAWPLERVTVSVAHEKDASQSPPDAFRRLVRLEGPLSAEQSARLYEMAERCPVHRTLRGGARVTTAPMEASAESAALSRAADADEHFEDMKAECLQADAEPAA